MPVTATDAPTKSASAASHPVARCSAYLRYSCGDYHTRSPQSQYKHRMICGLLIGMVLRKQRELSHQKPLHPIDEWLWRPKSCQRRTITSTYFGSSSISRALRPPFEPRSLSCPTTKGIHHHFPRATGIADCPFHQFHRLHGRMQIVLGWLLDLPDIPLVRSPHQWRSRLRAAVQYRFVLALVVGATQGESILGPDDEG